MGDYCAECDFTYDLEQASLAGDRVVELAAEINVILGRGDIDLRRRPRPDVWSPLEYGCHVRDMLLTQRERILLARRSNGADCTPMGREERVEHDGYNEQRPVDVARQLADAALLFSNVLTRLTPGDWDHRLVYNYPETRERSLSWIAIHTVHDVQHHLLDIRRQV